ncbi:hypothetical protein [uncultured Parabacteroides sp.]|uniref:hypothetical protein n=1 Tax=uncultured Parabacteroides sp. TaxID=512312 RepID=UPI002592E743|nr:hypothetical protein [uncultured Parabacteroides sp.]
MIARNLFRGYRERLVARPATAPFALVGTSLIEASATIPFAPLATGFFLGTNVLLLN